MEPCYTKAHAHFILPAFSTPTLPDLFADIHPRSFGHAANDERVSGALAEMPGA